MQPSALNTVHERQNTKTSTAQTRMCWLKIYRRLSKIHCLCEIGEYRTVPAHFKHAHKDTVIFKQYEELNFSALASHLRGKGHFYGSSKKELAALVRLIFPGSGKKGNTLISSIPFVFCMDSTAPSHSNCQANFAF